MRPRAVHLLLVVAACALVYWPLLGATGFASSEGHRVGPAWEMLETGDWAHLRLFGLTYLRKPPGMPWAIAISSSIFGQTEFGARAVSALACSLMGVVAYWFTNRWLGPPWGLAAGLIQALLPLFVTIGRTAEIDALNAFATQLFALGMVSALASRQRLWTRGLLPAAPAFIAVGLVLAGIVKGPASLPVFIGVGVAAWLQARSPAPLCCPRLWGANAVAAVALSAFGVWFTRVNADPNAVVQDFSEFTWSLARLAGTGLLLPASFLAACPASVGLIVLMVHRREPAEVRDAEHVPLASLLALSWVCSIVVLMLTGSSNPRYAMPAAVLLPPLAAWAVRACWTARGRSRAARVVLLGHPVVPLILMFIGWGVWLAADIRRPRVREGREAGRLIATHVAPGAVVWANDMVEARPDVLLYAEAQSRAAHPGGDSLTPRWAKPAILAGEMPAPSSAPVYLLLRSDAESGEVARYRSRIEAGELARVASGQVAKYEWVLLRVEEPRGTEWME